MGGKSSHLVSSHWPLAVGLWAVGCGLWAVGSNREVAFGARWTCLGTRLRMWSGPSRRRGFARANGSESAVDLQNTVDLSEHKAPIVQWTFKQGGPARAPG